ncbi:hypothetical protein EJ05DRAFT_375239 [Pseudovirgaria hyperparasitica]|uniref:SLS1 N-terminal domain-containing protein n=1 Tax=Pseudovirgaria hyperparasitica TaxID=470096 RepID=A0A6A6W531_9PEZI|nr:uncharacterized protein EJ05DRAFT_375239 [Pseudovirgaria hyperparasitica]KAF2758038.1 hypothetical protein EJ05DRAFT_375239 [Pseudovirgaria hyperparasitica]
MLWPELFELRMRTIAYGPTTTNLSLMVVGNTLSASICVRCQFRILQSSSLQYLPYSQGWRHRRYFSTSIHLRDDPFPPTSLPAAPGSEINQPTSHRHTSSSRIDRTHLGRSSRSVLKVHRGRFRETSSALATQRLGSPAEILVLKDQASLRATENDKDVVVNPKSIERNREVFEATLQAIRDNKKHVRQTDVDHVLDSLKPRHNPDEDAAYLTQDLYETLLQTVRDGFTVGQISRYVQSHTMEQEPSASDDKATVPWTKWRPGTSPLDVRLDPELQARIVRKARMPKRNKLDTVTKITNSMFDEASVHEFPAESRATDALNRSRETTKERLLRRLLKDCWKVQILEEIESVGELEIYITNTCRCRETRIHCILETFER